MNQTLQNILELQAALSGLREAEQRLNGIPDWMRELHEEHERRKSEIETTEASAEEAAKLRRAAETTVQDAQEKLKKYQQQINQVSTQREYGALLQEIDTVKGQITSQEEQAFSSMERHEQAQKDLEALRASFQDIKDRYATEMTRWEAEKPGIARQVEGFQARIADAARRPCLAPWSPSSNAFSTAIPREPWRACGSSTGRARSSASGTAAPATTACARRSWWRSAMATSWSSASRASASCTSRKCRPEAVSEPGLPERLARIHARIEEACRRSGRPGGGKGGVVLLGASKTQPAAALAEAWEAGLRVFGENRVQEGAGEEPRAAARDRLGDRLAPHRPPPVQQGPRRPGPLPHHPLHRPPPRSPRPWTARPDLAGLPSTASSR